MSNVDVPFKRKIKIKVEMRLEKRRQQKVPGPWFTSNCKSNNNITVIEFLFPCMLWNYPNLLACCILRASTLVGKSEKRIVCQHSTIPMPKYNYYMYPKYIKNIPKKDKDPQNYIFSFIDHPLDHHHMATSDSGT